MKATVKHMRLIEAARIERRLSTKLRHNARYISKGRAIQYSAKHIYKELTKLSTLLENIEITT